MTVIRPFRTQDFVLAAALISSGFPVVDKNQPCRNIYAAGNPFQPREDNPKLPLRPGIVEYYFVASPELTAGLKVWNEEVDRIRVEIEAAKAAGRPFIDGPTLTGVYPDDVLRTLAWGFHNHQIVKNLWREADPKIWARKKGTPKTRKLPDGGSFKSEPGFALVSRNASPEKLKKLGIV